MEIAKNRTYDELVKVGRKYYADKNFCSIVAIASVCNMSFGRAQRKMKELGRKKQGGASWWQIQEVVERRGFVVTEVSIKGYVRTAPKKLDSNCNYLLVSVGHVTAVMGGVVNDWTADAGQKNKLIVRAFKITKFEG